jgi:ferredoxin-NADP reductase
MAMLRHRGRRDDRTPATLLYSSRSVDDVIYRPELDAMAGRDRNLRVLHTLTRSQPAGWTGHRGRIDRSLLAEACFAPAQSPRIFVCGPTPLVESVARFLVELGHDPLAIKTERFGPTGG